MADGRWTAQQEAAIYKTDSDVLLTASAGSGKTSVLSERFLNLIISAEHHCSIDSILVMTFTNDAVAEMRKRISERLAGHVRENPSDRHVRKQLASIASAQICTLDSFSATLLKEFFYLSDIDPAFDIIDPKEKDLVLTSLMTEVLEDFYGDRLGYDSKAFYDFVNAYGGKGGDNNIPKLISAVGRFLETIKDCDKWLEGCVAGGDTIGGRLEAYKKCLSRSFIKQVDSAISDLKLCIKLLDEKFETVDHFRDLAAGAVEDLADLETVLGAGLSDSIVEKLSNKKNFTLYDRLSSKSKGVDPQEKDVVVALIKSARDAFEKIIGIYGGDRQLAKHLLLTDRYMHVVVDVYREYDRRYSEFKAENHYLDYSDISHKVLDILMDGDGPSKAARELQSRFDFILVDEYQDISLLQETLLQAVAKGCDGSGGNMFMVGDVKQSIYRFRQARPDIILGKHDSFTPVFSDEQAVDASTPEGGRIELNRNFRSRKEVVSFVNAFFSQTMTRGFGGIDYLNDGMMEYGAEYYDAAPCSYVGRYGNPIEFHLVNSQADESAESMDDADEEVLDSVKGEAVFVAARIKQMVESDGNGPEFEVLCPEEKKVRAVDYKDIAVLVRSLRSQADIYAEVFSSFGIPFHVQQDSGLFERIEMKYVISLLRLIDNPLQDIDLAAVLRGPGYDFSEAELAEIRTEHIHGYFYHAVLSYAEKSDTELARKIKLFMEQLEEWRTAARTGTLAELVRVLYRDLHLPEAFRCIAGGDQRYANLMFLYQVACEFDKFSAQGVGMFLRHLERLSSTDDQFGQAMVAGSGDNVVRIMTVHKSKGLEFPVVFVGGLAKGFNKAGFASALMLASEDDGYYGMDVKSSDGGESWSSLPKKILSDSEKLEELYEELRIQYVALTRAREHLVLVGSCKKDKLLESVSSIAALSDIRAEAGGDNVVSVADLETAKHALDWYVQAFCRSKAMAGYCPGLSEFESGAGKEFYFRIHEQTDILSYEQDNVRTDSEFDIQTSAGWCCW